MSRKSSREVAITDFEDYKPGVTDFVLGASKLGWLGPGDATDFIEVKGKKHTLKFVKYWDTTTRVLRYYVSIASMQQFKESEKFKITIDFTK